MNDAIEILAPGGDVNSIKAAILAGADAVYCGLDKFNARDRATNILFEDLNGILNLAHGNNCKIFITLNIIILEKEIPAVIRLLNKLVNTSIDGIIIQDFGLLYLVSKYFSSLEIHASTQMTTHNIGQIKFLKELSVSRVNLSRELDINDIKELTATADNYNISTEVFVHGSYCVSFSGLCYMSSVISGKSGNRGRCSQPCRDKYHTTVLGKNYPLNLKDNSAFFDLGKLLDAGVSSLKIEGRIKKFDYVYTVVKSYKEQLQNCKNDNSDLFTVFNRDFSNGFLAGNIDKNMFIDNPRDNSVKYLSTKQNSGNWVGSRKDLFLQKEAKAKQVKKEINRLSISKLPLKICISGQENTLLKVIIKLPEKTIEFYSEIKLVCKKSNLDYDTIFSRFKAINTTGYWIKELKLVNLDEDLFLPFKEITAIRDQIMFVLRGSKESIKPVTIPSLKITNLPITKPELSVLISDINDIPLCDNIDGELFFQMPACSQNAYSDFINLFRENPNLVPWFPEIIIGEDFISAVQFLDELRPKLIVTNNTGIAFEASKLNIPWIAGPHLNIANSYSLLCLQEKFNCSGAFLSNELNKNQLNRIISPIGLKLYYSIYHPTLLMTSRQCLFQPVIGCEKEVVDENCLHQCERSTSITNLKNDTFFIEKSKGNYYSIYNHQNYLNTDVVEKSAGKFSSYLIDLRNIKTETKVTGDKTKIITLFQNLLDGDTHLIMQIQQYIFSTTKYQYIRGI